MIKCRIYVIALTEEQEGKGESLSIMKAECLSEMFMIKCSILLLLKSFIYSKDTFRQSKMIPIFSKCYHPVAIPITSLVQKHFWPPRSSNPIAVTDKPLIINSQACRSQATLDLSFPTHAPNASWQFTDTAKSN